jgi:hypothetical protein
MTMDIRPINGGFQRQIRTTPFILGFLKGEGPEGSKKIDSKVGAPMTDIHAEYKGVLHRAYATNTVELEEERRINRGLPAFSEVEFNERLQHYLDRIPYKLFKMRYSSFCRYFGHLKRLGWVKESGRTEPSTIQESYPQAPSRVYYRITQKGRKATAKEIADPIQALYNYSRSQRSAKRHFYYRA